MVLEDYKEEIKSIEREDSFIFSKLLKEKEVGYFGIF